jgi:transcriptional regulator with XRE-family HTH domain
MPNDLQGPAFDGSALASLRARRGLSRPAFARKCREAGKSITPQHLGTLERNEHTPHEKTLHTFAVVIAKLYKITVDEAYAKLAGPQQTAAAA